MTAFGATSPSGHVPTKDRNRTFCDTSVCRLKGSFGQRRPSCICASVSSTPENRQSADSIDGLVGASSGRQLTTWPAGPSGCCTGCRPVLRFSVWIIPSRPLVCNISASRVCSTTDRTRGGGPGPRRASDRGPPDCFRLHWGDVLCVGCGCTSPASNMRPGGRLHRRLPGH